MLKIFKRKNSPEQKPLFAVGETAKIKVTGSWKNEGQCYEIGAVIPTEWHGGKMRFYYSLIGGQSKIWEEYLERVE